MPSKLINLFRDRVLAKPAKIALPEAYDPRVLRAMVELIEEKSVVTVHTLAKREELLAVARKNNIELTKFGDQIRYLEDEDAKCLDKDDELFRAGYLLLNSQVETVLAGAVFTTAEVARAAIRSVGLGSTGRTVSGSFIMNREHPSLTNHTFLYADCGVVVNPKLAQIQDIAYSTALTWKSLLSHLGEPKLAFLSFSTNRSADHQDAEFMAKARQEFQQAHPEIDSIGEIQFDAAFSKKVGKRKWQEEKIAGEANCFIFPNLNAGNIAYKITQYLGEFDAYGPILQGAAKPFSDLSRGATTEDIKGSVYINVLRARGV